MAWKTPKIDWTPVDGVTANDLNDIGNNLASLLEVTRNSMGAVTSLVETENPDTTQESMIITQHLNAPWPNEHAFIMTLFYATKTGNRSQIAKSYNAPNRMAMRTCKSDVWSPWSMVGEAPTNITGGIYKELFVDAALGTDAVDFGKSPGVGAFKSIGYALKMLPKVIYDQINISVAPGAYAYTPTPDRGIFIGGAVSIVASGARETTTISGISLSGFDNLSIRGFTMLGQSTIHAGIKGSFNNCINTGGGGFVFSNLCTGTMTNCTSNNNSSAFQFSGGIDVSVVNLTGTGNTTGIWCSGAIVRRGAGVTVTGTTPTRAEAGGQII